MPNSEFERGQNLTYQVLKKDSVTWEKVQDVIGNLNKNEFHMPPEDPILGENDHVIAYSSLKEAFQDPQTTTVAAIEGDSLIGYTFALPIDKMSPSRQSESKETAYIYFTAIIEEMRGKGLIGPLLDTLFMELQRNGYYFVERDSKINNGYADTVQKHYEKYPGSIIEMYDHNKFPEIGPERFFRIDINRYLQQRTA